MKYLLYYYSYTIQVLNAGKRCFCITLSLRCYSKCWKISSWPGERIGCSHRNTGTRIIRRCECCFDREDIRCLKIPSTGLTNIFRQPFKVPGSSNHLAHAFWYFYFCSKDNGFTNFHISSFAAIGLHSYHRLYASTLLCCWRYHHL